MSLKQNNIQEFKSIIWDYFNAHGRQFSWRQTAEPYHIVVSEIMLQQTQTHRVAGKFEQFITLFPTFQALAQAQLHDVLAAWQGLGYNRRAMALQKTAQKVVHEYNGMLPNDPEILVTFPGIGKATAASICAFAFNKPTTFIETNIRTVFIQFFFHNRADVHDKELFPLVERTVDQERPRLWYYALMDYGVMLKKNIPNPSRRSKHHTVQSKFEGSDRQIRGMILKILTQAKIASYHDFIGLIDRKEDRIQKILDDLCAEGFLHRKNDLYKIA
ncbi:MAG: A/G-specific adenine glycosylase [Candidatus Babeliales bacterium]